MALRDIIGSVRERERTLVLYDPASDHLVEQVREYLAPYSVAVESRSHGGTLSGHAELVHEDGSRLFTDCSSLSSPLTQDAFEACFGDALTRIDRTTFSSYDGSQMVATSREIEDRAWRYGHGSLHAGFQRVSALQTQEQVYRDLARKQLDIHAYAVPDADAPPLDGVDVHLVEDDEIAKTWFVVYDGGGDDDAKCALLAEERDPDVFRGFWTYDPAVVDAILSHLAARYAPLP
ncbi:DICT sensory domain-containing protein [Halogeometricum limi]|uniref:Diguanylate Cyclase and Two-component system sensory domain-containing protein n=1 Tax=Halogeometricum limi TaxID=555875 RepID=A0A1I6GJ83_9EURY|nr:DICT sensory domain-containing protein [Halogeometricum limi]SFR42255.1 Diguanylate Cyclase and Two-component system sensory domain-containing protein [Halogeometricum limi]